MHFYVLSCGEYSDYGYTIIYHEKKFTKKEFAQMYNDVVTILRKTSIDAIADGLQDKYGFKIVQTTWEINNGYHGFEHYTEYIDDVDIALVSEKESDGENIYMKAKAIY